MTEADENIRSPKKDSDPFIQPGCEITDKMLEDNFEEVYKNYPINDDTTCGFGFLRGSFLQM